MPRKSEKKKEIEKNNQYIKGLDDNDKVVQILKEYDQKMSSMNFSI
jgi:hypothetical protein